MKLQKASIILFALLLAACAPQVTVTSEATSTAAPTLPPPTATIVPTPAISPEFLDLQAQVAASGTDLTLGSDGTFEQKMPDGTYKDIAGIHVNPATNQIEIMVNGASVVIDRSKISFDGGTIQIDGYSYDSANGEYDELVKYDEATWASMDQVARDEVLAKLPETMTTTIGEQEVTLSRGSFSTVKDNVVRYEDATKRVVQGYDVLTGEYKNALDAGVYDLQLDDGTFFEVLGFHTEAEALYYMAEIDGAHGTYKDRLIDPDFDSVFVTISYKIAGFSQFGAVSYYTNAAGESFYVESVEESEGEGEQLKYLSGDDKATRVYVVNRYLQ